jgi:hypothetical protein
MSRLAVVTWSSSFDMRLVSPCPEQRNDVGGLITLFMSLSSRVSPYSWKRRQNDDILETILLICYRTLS